MVENPAAGHLLADVKNLSGRLRKQTTRILADFKADRRCQFVATLKGGEDLMEELHPIVQVMEPKDLRPLKRSERVQAGDFVENGRQGFELWEGPAGFRADSFVKQIYRRKQRPG